MNLPGSDAVGVAVGLATLASVAAGVWIKARKRWRRGWDRAIGALETIAGRPEIVDRATGKVLVAKQDGVADRLDRVEGGQAQQATTLEQMATAMQKLADGLAQQHQLEKRVDQVEADVADLKAAQVERVVARAETTAAYRAIETAIKATPDLESDTTEDE